MTLEAIEKRLSRLERQERKGREILLSTQFEKYEDYLVEAKKQETSVSMVYQALTSSP